MIYRRFNHPPHNHGILSGNGEVINSSGNALDIHDADVHNYIVNKYLHQHTTTVTTLTADSAVDDYQISVASGVGFAVGDYLHINTTSEETTHPRITALSGTTPDVFTLDRRLDVAHVIGDAITKSIVDMSTTAGTIAAPQEYWVGPVAGEVWHLERILFELTHGTAGDLGLFGNLPALTNGVVLRVKRNGEYGTLTNWKQNSNIKVDMFDVQFDPRSGGGGSYGTTGRGTFKNTGAVLKLDGDTNDRLEVYIQDDITGLDSFTMKAQGHYEGR